MEQVILVDENDVAIGTMPKLEAHEKAALHRAFSVFVFNSAGEMLLQQRAAHKYHSAGLWSNTCCSHPRPGELTADAALRRLDEEMGFTTLLKKTFDFVYRATFGNGLTEYEFDHVYTGIYDGVVTPDDNEVGAYRYLPMQTIQQDLQQQPQQYTAWFHIAFPKVMAWWEKEKAAGKL